MTRLLLLLATLVLGLSTTAYAEYRQIDLTIFGMD